MSEDDLIGWIGFWNRQVDEGSDIQVECYLCGHVYKKSLGRCPMCENKHFDSLEELDDYFLNESLRRS